MLGLIVIFTGLAVAIYWVMSRELSMRSLAVRQALAAAGLVLTVLLVLRGVAWLSVPVAMVSIALLAQSLGRPKPERRARSGPETDMTKAQAASLLGISPTASEIEIQAAYRRAMKSAHPDVGGSDEQAARVQQARDVLLGER